MKKSWLAIVAMLSGIQFAHAADLPAAPPVYTKSEAAAPQWDWSGFYIGLHGGYGWGHDPHSATPFDPLNTPNIESRGAVAGGQAGYNWQSGVLLGGLEVDMTWTNISGGFAAIETDPTVPFTSAQSVQDRINYMGTARARFGVLPFQGTLLYGTVGPAWAQTTQTTSSVLSILGLFNSTTGSVPTTRFGWSAGAGVEEMLAPIGLPHWLVRVEYLHYDFGGKTSNSGTIGSPPVTVTNTTASGPITADVVRGGVGYKF